jgi:hypothetical protein
MKEPIPLEPAWPVRGKSFAENKVLATDPEVPGSIPGPTRFSEK